VALPEAAARKPEAKKPEPKKLEAKKPSEPRPPADKPIRRAPPERVARASNKAQPIDPYASPSTPAVVAGPPGPPSATAADKSKPDPAAAYKTGIQQYARGDTAGALATFRASAAATPGFAPTWRGLGLVYEKLGNKGMARLAFKRYLQLAPGAGDADQIRDRMEHLGS
jgi:tetratricopeptide (TPR) repeat protein